MAPYLLDELYEWLAYHCVNISDIFLSILTDSRFAYHSHELLEDLLLSFPKILAAFSHHSVAREVISSHVE